jgi:hypothetical protein
MTAQLQNKPSAFRYVESVNGKTNSVSIESADGSVKVDNSRAGKVLLSSSGGPGGNNVQWSGPDGNTINHDIIEISANSLASGSNLALFSNNSAVYASENVTRINAGANMYLDAGHNMSINAGDDLHFTGQHVDINELVITYDQYGVKLVHPSYGLISLNWGHVDSIVSKSDSKRVQTFVPPDKSLIKPK